MSDMSEQGQAEVLDDDVTGAGDFPPDEPLGLPELLGRDTTVAGESVPDSLAERIAREEASDAAAMVDEPVELVDDRPDGETDLAADLGEPDLEDVTRLSDEVPGRAEDPSPEAAAIHLVDDGSV